MPVDAIEIDPTNNVELARYFGKHLGCALAYESFPIPRRLSRFVGVRSVDNCVSVSMRQAPLVYKDVTGKYSPLNLLGGAILLYSDKSSRPFSYRSAYMTDHVQLIVEMRLSICEAMEIRFAYRANPKNLRYSDGSQAAQSRGF